MGRRKRKKGRKKRVYNLSHNFPTRLSSYSRNRLWRPIGLWDVKDPILSRRSVHRWRHGCQPYAPAALYSSETLFKTQGLLVRPEGLCTSKTFLHLIGSRNCHLLACSIPPSYRLPKHAYKMVSKWAYICFRVVKYLQSDCPGDFNRRPTGRRNRLYTKVTFCVLKICFYWASCGVGLIVRVT
jgi:hypothetical protein